MSRVSATRTTVFGVLLVAVGSFLPSITVPPWNREPTTPWTGPAGHFGLFFYDYLVLEILLVTVIVSLSVDSGKADGQVLVLGGLLILAARGWFVWEEFVHDFATSGFTLGWGVYVSVIGALLLLVAGYRGTQSGAERGESRAT